VLPKPYKKGREFLGWSTDPEGVGYIYELPAGFVGTVYAIWDVMDGTTTGMDQLSSPDFSQPLYDILGRPVTPAYRGVVIQNGKPYFIR
jgi:hypothetical protein